MRRDHCLRIAASTSGGPENASTCAPRTWSCSRRSPTASTTRPGSITSARETTRRGCATRSRIRSWPTRCAWSRSRPPTLPPRAGGASAPRSRSATRSPPRGSPSVVSDAILDALHAAFSRAVRAAEDLVLRLDAVHHDAAPAVRAHRREQVNRAFEAVEHVRLATLLDGEGLVVRVSAYLATLHQTALR